AAEREEAEREREAQAEAERQRQTWETKWIEYALKSVPSDAPQSSRLDVHQTVGEALQRHNSRRAPSITRELVDAAVDRALEPWKKLKQVAAAINEACEAYSIPWEMKRDTAWKARMCEAAGTGIARLRQGAARTEIETAARQAIVPLVREFDHRRTC